jgi:hypothetical protein
MQKSSKDKISVFKCIVGGLIWVHMFINLLMVLIIYYKYLCYTKKIIFNADKSSKGKHLLDTKKALKINVLSTNTYLILTAIKNSLKVS